MILDYAKWKKIYEQTTVTSGNDAITFVVSAGASTKPMSDETLAQKQGYPSADKLASTTIYELSLSDALNKKFANAISVGQAASSELDQIIFENNSIKNKGKLIINWTPAIALKKIRVSGNGALALARAAHAFKFDKNATSGKGVIILELAANDLYSNIWSVGSMGLSVSSLMVKLKGIISQCAVQTANPQLKPSLVSKWKNNPAAVETQYCPAIIEYDSDGKQSRFFPSLKENTSLKEYYGKYASEDFIKNKKALTTLAPIIKTNIVDPGLDALSKYIDSYLKQKMIGIDPTYISRFTPILKSNIEKAKATMTTLLIEDALYTAVAGEIKDTLPSTASQTTVQSTKYKEGESN